jgi:voltage-gated potassium channel
MLLNTFRNTYWRRRRYLKFIKHNERHFLIRLGKTTFILLLLIVTHSVAISYIENLPLDDALWLSITTVTTVGYGDYSATTTAGRIVTAIFLYGIAISLLAQLAAEFFDYRSLVKDRKITGHWRWKKMKDHILIINTPNEDTVNYLTRFISQVRISPELQEMPIQILTRKFDNGLPSSLTHQGVVHYSGVAESNENLNAVNVQTSKYIILIARDAIDPMSDSLTFDILSRIKEIGTNAIVIVEATQDINRERMKNAGANIVIRPVRAYPELIVRSMVAPGSEEVLENMFTHDDDRMVRLNLEFSGLTWADIICRFVKGGAGLPMAFISDEGIDVNPLPDKVCAGTGIITLINDTQEVTEAKAISCLS